MQGQGRSRVRKAAFLTVVTALLVGACSGSSGPSSSAVSGSPAASSSAPAAATITMWVNSADAQPLKDL